MELHNVGTVRDACSVGRRGNKTLPRIDQEGPPTGHLNGEVPGSVCETAPALLLRETRRRSRGGGGSGSSEDGQQGL